MFFAPPVEDVVAFALPPFLAWRACRATVRVPCAPRPAPCLCSAPSALRPSYCALRRVTRQDRRIQFFFFRSFAQVRMRLVCCLQVAEYGMGAGFSPELLSVRQCFLLTHERGSLRHRLGGGVFLIRATEVPLSSSGEGWLQCII